MRRALSRWQPCGTTCTRLKHTRFYCFDALLTSASLHSAVSSTIRLRQHATPTWSPHFACLHNNVHAKDMEPRSLSLDDCSLLLARDWATVDLEHMHFISHQPSHHPVSNPTDTIAPANPPIPYCARVAVFPFPSRSLRLVPSVSAINRILSCPRHDRCSSRGTCSRCGSHHGATKEKEKKDRRRRSPGRLLHMPEACDRL